MTVARVVTVVLATSVSVVLGAAPARGADVPDCTESSATDVPQLSHQQSKPLDLLDIADAQKLASESGGVPGSGVTVAVVDSGIAPHGQVTVAAAHAVHTGSAVVHTSDYHGTAAVGLIAGRSRPNGGTRVLTAPATSWAAAEVGGIAALLFQRYADESPRQIAARTTDTASGTTSDGASGDAATSRYFGAGVVQPVDALTRPLTATGRTFSSLRARPEQTPPVRPPVEQSDALHDTRGLAVWVGLLGGAAIVVASILRPLLSRRPPR